MVVHPSGKKVDGVRLMEGGEIRKERLMDTITKTTAYHHIDYHQYIYT
jgi:hypothetical protein